MTLTEQEIIAEGILDTLKTGVDKVKQYANTIKSASSAHQKLRSLDGTKTFTTETLKDEAIRLRKEIIAKLSTASVKVQNIVIAAIKKLGAAALQGIYTSRNYYHDFIIYTMAQPILDMTGGKALKFGAAYLADKLFGILITTVTGMPSLDDIKDMGQMASGFVKVTSDMARKIDSLKPTDIAECFKSCNMSLLQELRSI